MTRRSTRAAAINAAASQPSAGVSANKDALLQALQSKVESGTDCWFVVPFKGMNSESAEKNYGKYIHSNRVLSTMIDADGEEFAKLLFDGVCGVRGKPSKDVYMKENFGVKTMIVRSKILLINFNKDASYCNKWSLSGDLPDLCSEPVQNAKNTLVKSGNTLSRSLILDFVKELKASAIRDAALSLYKAVDQLQGLCSRPIDLFLLESLQGQSDPSSKEDPFPPTKGSLHVAK